MNTFKLEIVATDRAYYNGPCESLVVPCEDGERGIMAKHEPMFIAVIPGELRYTVDGEVNYVAIGDGFVHVTPHEVTVITNFAESPDEIDQIRAERELQIAQEQAKMLESDPRAAHIEFQLSRKLAELKVAKHRHINR